MLDQRIDDRLSVLAIDLRHHEIARITFDQRGDLAVVGAKDQVAFPMPGNCSVSSRRWSLTEGEHVTDLAVITGFLRVMARTTHGASAPKVLQQLFFQGAASLYV